MARIPGLDVKKNQEKHTLPDLSTRGRRASHAITVSLLPSQGHTNAVTKAAAGENLRADELAFLTYRWNHRRNEDIRYTMQIIAIGD